MQRIGMSSPTGTAIFRLTSLLAIVLAVVIVNPLSAWTKEKPTGPQQPASGPGGADYAHKQVVANMYGKGATRYWIFEPADPKPENAPVILFNHGWGAMEPLYYGAWIDHIVKRGSIVIFPVYQDSLRTLTSDFTPNAAAGIRSAIDKLQSKPGHVKPQLDKVAIVGHSMGGVITANLGAQWKQLGIPLPKALMCVEPGKTSAMSRIVSIKLADMSMIPKDTLLLTIAGDRDLLVRDIDAKRIFRESTNVLPQNKNYIVLVSDDHGLPPLIADHRAPIATNPKYTDVSAEGVAGQTLIEWQLRRNTESTDDSPDDMAADTHGVDALGFYGVWKLFDALTDAAFYGRNREYALGNTPQQRFMGTWSDGAAVNELQVTTIP